MFLNLIHIRPRWAIAVLALIALAPAAGAQTSRPTHSSALRLKFIRVFSSPGDLRPEHEILNRALDIVAGPADPVSRVDALKSPVAVTSDSRNRVFVADPGAKTVHIFDFAHSRYGQLDVSGRLTDPVALATDAQDNLYVVDQISRAVFVYDAAGKFRRTLGKLRGRESYFENPTSIAVDRGSGRIYVCDRFSHMVLVMDQRGKVLRRIGKRGGGSGSGEFRLPSQVVSCGNGMCILDSGNSRIQILDATGRFQRAINVGYAGHGTGLAADAQANVFVSDPGVDQIQVFSPTGQALHILDLSAVEDANVGHPAALWIDAGGKLYTIDSQNNRVAEFEIEP